ncbi:MAG: glycosyltransferase family 4 protein [Desulfobacterales bacterium]
MGALQPDPIRVLLFSSFANRGRGGQESLFHLACRLDPSRFRPCVVVPGEGSLAQSLRARDVEVCSLDLPRIGWNRGHQAAAALRRLLTLVDRLDIDLLHTDGPRNTLYAGVVGRLRQKPVIWHVRASTPDPYDPLLSMLPSRILLVANALEFRFTSNAAKRKIRVIHNGVDLDRFRPGDEENVAGPLSPGGEVVIGTVGRVEKEKGILTLLKAMRLLKTAPSTVRLRVAGDFTDAAYFNRCTDYCRDAGISDRVQFLGHVHPAEDFLRTVGVFVLPSVEAEAFPRAVLEAMACGKPVVATNAGGTREAVDEGRTGFVVPARSPRAMADRLRTLIGSAQLRAQMGRCGRERAEALFGIERNTELTAQVYEEAARA